MSTSKVGAVPAPGVVWGVYPERAQATEAAWQQLVQHALNRLRLANFRGTSREQRLVASLHGLASELRLETLAAARLAERVQALRAPLARSGFDDPALIAECFALVRELTRRCLGKAQFDTQLIAAHIMLQGQLAEMATGEGKTLAALLAAATAALAGAPVHVITANDYLVKRDAETLRPVYRALGLSVGIVVAGQGADARRAAYTCDVTYCTAKELVFDYLRDRLLLAQTQTELQRRVEQLCVGVKAANRPLLRGLCVAIIDEADSILIDEARTPLILARAERNAQESDYYARALTIARELQPGLDFHCDQARRAAALTEQGRARVAQKCAGLGALWRNSQRREELVMHALSALHAFERDRHYLVRDQKIMLVDDATGRLAPGRAWSRGLHQLIELKEGCDNSLSQTPIAQITYQRFFPRYLRLGGMSGTLAESAHELRCVYGLRVTPVALRMGSQRTRSPIRMFRGAEEKWRAALARVTALHQRGQPVLIGTNSVAESELLSLRLQAANLPHRVLNARHDADEATIVAEAGQRGQITIATNMAGRGTDILLGAGVRELGGLCVISCQLNDARRIDRQLHGRCARQGDPGSVETLLSLEDPLIARFWPERLRRMLAQFASEDAPLPSWLAVLVASAAQRIEESRQFLERWRLLRQDRLVGRRMSFSGPSE